MKLLNNIKRNITNIKKLFTDMISNEQKDRKKETPGKVDAEIINEIIKYHGDAARMMGRYTAFSLIAAAWTMSYQYSQFRPATIVKWSFVFAILYLLFDYIFFIYVHLRYKWILKKCFDSKAGEGFILKTGDEAKDPNRYSLTVARVGKWQLIICASLLITSAVLLIIHIISIQL